LLRHPGLRQVFGVLHASTVETTEISQQFAIFELLSGQQQKIQKDALPGHRLFAQIRLRVAQWPAWLLVVLGLDPSLQSDRA
jgi:hypothetical protein